MWKAAWRMARLILVSAGMTLVAPGVFAQGAAVELANLREDVRLLSQRVGELNLRVEQLERDNNALRSQTAGAAQDYATLVQLNEAVADLNRAIKAAMAGAKSETLQQVSVQMEALAKQTNAAIDSLARGVAQRASVATPTFTDNYSKEGVPYVVQKGDTLSSIAAKAGARLQDIINANKIADPTRIQVGQTLFIPIAP